MENVLEASINFSKSLVDSNTQFVMMISSGIDDGVMEKYQDSNEFKEALFIFLIFLNYKKIHNLYYDSDRLKTFNLSLLNTLKNSHGIESRRNLELYIDEFEGESDFIGLINISCIKYFIEKFDKNASGDLLVITSCLNLLRPMISSIDSIDKDFLKGNYNLIL